MTPRLRGAAALLVLLSCARGEGPPRAAEDHGPGDGHGHAADAARGPGDAPAAPSPGPALCAHGVPGELCTRCDPDLAAVFQAQGDWCAEHGLPESHCRACNPGLTFTAAAAAPADWCREHAVPESRCTKCSPALVAKAIVDGDYCRAHGFPESVCPFCHPERVRAAGYEPPATAPFETIVRLSSIETVREAGIATRRVDARPFARTLEVVGQLELDGNRRAAVSAPAEALVQAVKVDAGDAVRAGAPVVVLASSAVGAGQAQLAAARSRLAVAEAALERERALAAKGISTRDAVDAAERERAAARAELESAGAMLGAAGGAGGSGGRLVLSAPVAGTVVSRSAVVGRTVAAGEVLVEIADLSRLWAQLDVPESDAALVRPGQPVRIVLEAGGRVVEGRIARVASTIDPQTRTVRARVELPNPDGTLRAGALVRASIAVGDSHSAVLVPRDAVQHADGRTLVFVREGPVAFRPVRVDLGARTGDEVEIAAGLAPGAEVVTTGAFLLKTELMQDAIGAGCCEPAPGGEGAP